MNGSHDRVAANHGMPFIHPLKQGPFKIPDVLVAFFPQLVREVGRPIANGAVDDDRTFLAAQGVCERPLRCLEIGRPYGAGQMAYGELVFGATVEKEGLLSFLVRKPCREGGRLQLIHERELLANLPFEPLPIRRLEGGARQQKAHAVHHSLHQDPLDSLWAPIHAVLLFLTVKQNIRLLLCIAFAALLHPGCAERDETGAYLYILGIAQDGGVPQAGRFDHPGWDDPKARRLPTSLGLIDTNAGRRWLFEATPAFPEQLQRLHTESVPRNGKSPHGDEQLLDGIFLTHAHIGHYSGLVHLGHEVMGAESIPVYAMPRMANFLELNGPWSQLIDYQNIVINRMQAELPIHLGGNITVTPLVVPHRQEFSEVVGYRIEGPKRSVLFIPDIDSWEEWDEIGVRIEDEIKKVDVALLDGTFFDNGEIPGRDMSGFPHPFITHSLERFSKLPKREKKKIRFIHLNHTNPALVARSDAWKKVISRGFRIAEEGERISLD